MEKGFFQLKDNKYVPIEGMDLIIKVFQKGELFEFHGFLFRKVEYLDPYDI